MSTQTRATPFNLPLARVLGLRIILDTDSFVTMPAQDWRLYDRALNPASKITLRYLKHCGNEHLWIGGIDTLSDEPYWFLDRCAEACPDRPHFAVWRDSFKPANVR